MPETQIPDYYELLEISPQATPETIHRVYRYMAARYHPDVEGTGNLEKFTQLTSAHKVLSDPKRRSEYDALRATRQPTVQNPMSGTIDFMDQAKGDLNRRLAVLAILYYRRRMCPNSPEVSLNEIEQRMGFPRDYLDFTTWYLAKKKYITKADNSDFTLTIEGVDFIETQRASVPVLDKLLTNGSHTDDNEALSRLAPESPSPESSGGQEFPVDVLETEMISHL